MNVKYLIGKEVYLDFNTVVEQIGSVRSIVFKKLKKSNISFVRYKNLNLYNEGEIAELLKMQTKK